ncbi:hypothetical protein DTO271G3_3618 [Paecilomyces variotii]|nr:hypothetical protein DTO271G3_3618 [Paecilomyces variotii]
MGFYDVEKQCHATPVFDDGVETCSEMSRKVQQLSDSQALQRQGKRPQLKRQFGFMSMLGFSTTLMATWEPLAALLQGGLVNGGPVSLVYGYILCFFGTLATAASLGELASMAPTSGGQYHWVALLSPPGASIHLSWVTGWVTVIAWMAAVASPAFLGGTIIQGLLVLNDESYVFERWHGTLLFTAIVVLSVCVNIFAIKYLPHLETLMLLLHVGMFFLLLIPMVYLAPQHSAKFVFTDFESLGGWNNNGIAWCVGLMTSAFPFTGWDGAAHMSEEIENAEVIVPRSLMMSILLNGALGFGFLIAVLFSMGDLQAALATPTGYPIIEIFYQATGSKKAATAMVCGLVASAVFSTLGLMASASRTTWAFARDNGLPLSDRIAHIDQKRALPVTAVMVTAGMLLLLGLINIGNTAAFSAIVGLATVALYFTYMMPIILLVIRRLRGDSIHFGPWRLGRFGLWVNLFSIVYLVFTSFFMFFPSTIPVTTENFNWTSVVFLAVLAISFISYWTYGRRLYRGPVKEVAD